MDSITLSGLLPRVFISENIPPSEVWRSPLRFERGKTYLVEAASGGGKSSLAAFLYGLRDDYEGKLLFNERDTRTYTISDWQETRRRHIAYLPQELALFPELTALDNIRLKLALTGDPSESMALKWMERLGMSGRLDYPAGKLSIGQQQRVALVRSLCQPFDFILLDEPVSHLDEANNRIAAAIVAEEAARRGAGVIMTSVGNPLLLPDAVRLKL
ncbi:MAG: ATP-binding cassette domain-containing protein [Muribaculaceae bacterium]|nr:ATP-binding cassette domain-containing protein [Muribaculaceae bacterium]